MNKQFPVSLDNIYQMLEFVRENALAAGIEKANVSKIELAVEEAITNIICYSGLGPNSTIDIDCVLDSSGIKITLIDEGVAFNPLSKANKEIDPTIPLENRELGGFGIHLIVNLMDKVEYHRGINRNILTLTKYSEK